MNQLIPSFYFRQDVFDQERASLFATTYVGHVSMAPNIGDYAVLPWDKGMVLYHNSDGYQLMSNVCRHRQALILEGSGNAPSIVCNIHGWTYDQQGKLQGAPRFDDHPCDRSLQTQKLQEVGGLLFRGEALPEKMFEGFELNMADFQFDRRDVVKYQFNWKTFMEVYGEDYHVDPFHPGLSSFVDTAELQWKMEEAYHVCTVGYNKEMPRGTAYRAFQTQVKKVMGDDFEPKYGAVWHFVYPNLMVEFYPGSMVIAYINPISPEECEVYTEYFYTEEINCFEPEFKDAQRKAYEETTVEDDEICYRMHQGRKALWLRGEADVGPYQSHLEAGMKEFHDFYHKRMTAKNDQRRTIPISNR